MTRAFVFLALLCLILLRVRDEFDLENSRGKRARENEARTASLRGFNSWTRGDYNASV